MKKKGFTLIELLAVIIILAIIALIATPIIMRVIERSKKGAAERSAENYIHAVETAVLAERTNGNTINDGTYGINPNGNLCPNNVSTCNAAEEIKIEMSGKKPSSGSVVISNGKVQSTGTSIVIGDYTATIASNGSATATKGSSEYTQVYKPQYYVLYADISIGSDAPENPSSVAPEERETYPIYAGYDVSDNKVSAAYLCFFRNGKEYCLKGYTEEGDLENRGTSPYYSKNVEILEDAFGDTNTCRYNSFDEYLPGNGEFSCSGGLIYASTHTYGYLYVNLYDYDTENDIDEGGECLYEDHIDCYSY